MGKIKARAAQRTFSADLGQLLWLPGSFLAFRLFPGLWEILDVRGPSYQRLGSCALTEFPTGVFLAATDWITGEISIRLQSKERLQIWHLRAAEQTGFTATLRRSNDSARMALEFGNLRQAIAVDRQEQLRFTLSACGSVRCEVGSSVETSPSKTPTQILFGCHKASEWGRMNDRSDLTQIGPILQLAGQWVDRAFSPLEEELELEAQSALQLAGLNQSDNSLPPAFTRVWRAHFGKWALPRWDDEDHQGHTPVWKAPISPLYLYSVLGRWLAARLWKDEKTRLCLLPAPPAICHAGRVLGACALFGTFDLYWSKKKLAQIFLRCCHSGRYCLKFPQGAHQVRLRRLDRRFGIILPLPPSLELTIALERGKAYHLDRLRG